MIKKSQEMISEIRERMRGGNGSVQIIHIVNADEIKGKARLCARILLEPGCSIGMHEHVNEEEIYYILKGNGMVNDDGTCREISAGDAVITGGGAAHSIENTGAGILEIMAVILLYE